MENSKRSRIYNANHLCFDQVTAANLSMCGFQNVFCYADDLCIGSFTNNLKEKMNVFLAYIFSTNAEYRFIQAKNRKVLIDMNDFLNAINNPNNEFIIWFSNASWEYIGALFALSKISDDRLLYAINCSESIHGLTGKPFMTSAQACNFSSDKENDFLCLIKEQRNSKDKLLEMRKEWSRIEKEEGKVHLIRKGAVESISEALIINIIRSYCEKEKQNNIDILLYKVQDRVYKDMGILISPKFIFYCLYKHEKEIVSSWL